MKKQTSKKVAMSGSGAVPKSGMAVDNYSSSSSSSGGGSLSTNGVASQVNGINFRGWKNIIV